MKRKLIKDGVTQKLPNGMRMLHFFFHNNNIKKKMEIVIQLCYKNNN